MRRTWSGAAALALSLAAMDGCAPQASGSNTPDAEQAKEDTWARGVFLYGQHCAGCHGDDGEGGEDRPALAPLARDPRAGSERKVAFRTAADVQGYVRANMPPLEAGSLSDADAWALTLYVLRQAGVTAPNDLGAGNGARVKLP